MTHESQIDLQRESGVLAMSVALLTWNISLTFCDGLEA